MLDVLAVLDRSIGPKRYDASRVAQGRAHLTAPGRRALIARRGLRGLPSASAAASTCTKRDWSRTGCTERGGGGGDEGCGVRRRSPVTGWVRRILQRGPRGVRNRTAMTAWIRRVPGWVSALRAIVVERAIAGVDRTLAFAWKRLGAFGAHAVRLGRVATLVDAAASGLCRSGGWRAGPAAEPPGVQHASLRSWLRRGPAIGPGRSSGDPVATSARGVLGPAGPDDAWTPSVVDRRGADRFGIGVHLRVLHRPRAPQFFKDSPRPARTAGVRPRRTTVSRLACEECRGCAGRREEVCVIPAPAVPSMLISHADQARCREEDGQLGSSCGVASPVRRYRAGLTRATPRPSIRRRRRRSAVPPDPPSPPWSATRSGCHR